MEQQNKEQQKKLLTEIMEADQKNGLYDNHIGDTNKMVTMKLYTEEQVKQMIDDAHNDIDGYYDIFKKHTPIKLPSDEEIIKIASRETNNINEQIAFNNGAIYVCKLIEEQILNK